MMRSQNHRKCESQMGSHCESTYKQTDEQPLRPRFETHRKWVKKAAQ